MDMDTDTVGGEVQARGFRFRFASPSGASTVTERKWRRIRRGAAGGPSVGQTSEPCGVGVQEEEVESSDCGSSDDDVVQTEGRIGEENHEESWSAGEAPLPSWDNRYRLSRRVTLVRADVLDSYHTSVKALRHAVDVATSILTVDGGVTLRAQEVHHGL